METRSPFSELSDDLLVEIISRVPFKSTRRCKCVCRRWRDVVSHPDHRYKLPRTTLAGYFYRTGHLCGQLTNRGHYESLTGNWCPGIDPSLSFLPKYTDTGLCEFPVETLDCCNGLLLCRRRRWKFGDERAEDYVVCNPATKTWVVVPGTDWPREAPVARLGFDPTISSHFHVFEFALDTHAKPLGIYSSRAGAWTHPTDWDCPIDISNFSGSTYLRGELYLSSYYGKVVAAVNMEGNCRVIPVPTSTDGSSRTDGLYSSQGRLYLEICRASELSIWVLEDSNTDSWALKLNVTHLQLFGAEEYRYYGLIEKFIIHPEYNVLFLFFRSYRGFPPLSMPKLLSYDMDSRVTHFIRELGYDSRGPYLSYVPLFSHSPADED